MEKLYDIFSNLEQFLEQFAMAAMRCERMKQRRCMGRSWFIS